MQREELLRRSGLFHNGKLIYGRSQEGSRRNWAKIKGKELKKLKINMNKLRKRPFCKLPRSAHCPSMVEKKLEWHSDGFARL